MLLLRRLWGAVRALALVGEPIVRLEARWLRALLWPLATGREHRAQVRAARRWWFWWAPCVPIPYLVPPLFAFLGDRLKLPASDTYPLTMACLLWSVAGVGVGAGWNALTVSALSLARDRDLRLLEARILTRMSAAEILTGRALALLVPIALGFCLVFLPWVLVPPIPPGAHVLSLRLGDDPRQMLLLLWADGLAVAVACAFTGLAAATWCRSQRTAVLGPAVVSLAVFVLLLPLAACLTGRVLESWEYLGPLVTLGARIHQGLWAACAAITLIAFVLAQLRIGPVPTPLHLIPGIRWPRVAAPRSKAAGNALVVALIAALVWAYTAQLRLAWGSLPSPLRAAERRVGRSPAGELMDQRHYRRAAALLEAEIRRGPSSPLDAWVLWTYKAYCHESLREERLTARAFSEAARVSEATLLKGQSHESAAQHYAASGDRGSAARECGLSVRASLAVLDRYRRLAGPPADEAPTAESQIITAARMLVRLGDRLTAVFAYRVVYRSADPEMALEARQELALLHAGLAEAPRMGIILEEAPPYLLHYASGESGLDGWRAMPPPERIVEVDGRPVTDWLSLMRILSRHRPGDTVDVVGMFGGQRQHGRVRLHPP